MRFFLPWVTLLQQAEHVVLEAWVGAVVGEEDVELAFG